MTERSTHWWYHFQGDTYGSQIHLKAPRNEKEVRTLLREFMEVPRLPNGTEVWRA